MTKTNQFLQNTDYIILSSDDVGIINLTIPAGSTISSNSNRFFESISIIGTSPAAPLRSIFRFNGSTSRFIATRVNFDVSVTYGSITTTVPLQVSIERVGDNFIRLYALVSNGTASTMTLNQTTQIEVKVRSFKTPFAS